MPAMEADPGRQRHGGAPRGGLPVAREGPRLASVASRFTSATCSRLAPPGAPPTPRLGGAVKRKQGTWRRNAGNEETALFDIVKMERREWCIANRSAIASTATHSVLAEGAPRCVLFAASSGNTPARACAMVRAPTYPPPCGEGRPPKRSGGGRGGGRSCCAESRPPTTTPTPNPSPQGGGEHTESAAAVIETNGTRSSSAAARDRAAA